jgi:hypothetical protein
MNFCLVTYKNEQCSVQLPFGQFCLMTHNVLIKMENFVTYFLVLDQGDGFCASKIGLVGICFLYFVMNMDLWLMGVINRKIL